MFSLEKLIRSNYKYSIQITKQVYSVKYTRILNEKCVSIKITIRKELYTMLNHLRSAKKWNSMKNLVCLSNFYMETTINDK